jgi:hypothetical protein
MVLYLNTQNIRIIKRAIVEIQRFAATNMPSGSAQPNLASYHINSQMAAADQALLDQIQRLSGTCISFTDASRLLTGVQARYGKLGTEQRLEVASRMVPISIPGAEVEGDINTTSLHRPGRFQCPRKM